MDLSNMCRVCLLPESRVYLMDWHQPIDSPEYVLSYKECFCQCTQINLRLKDDPNDMEDGRSQYLCLCCAQSLKEAHEFIEKAKRADNEIRSRKIDKNFEWVAVSAKVAGINKREDSVVNDQNCLDETNDANIWTNETTDVTVTNFSNNIDDEDISIANLKKELVEPFLIEKRKPTEKTKQKRKVLPLADNTKSKDDESCMDETDIASSRESDPDFIIPYENSKIDTKKNHRRKVQGEKTKRSKINMEEMIACPVCQKVIKRRALRRHKRAHRPKTLLCKACPRTFRDSSTLRNHERTHEENRKRFPCEKCSQSFLSHYYYKEHLKTHDANRKPAYQCTQCDKKFLQKGGLLTHMLHHDGPKWKCTFCEKRYIRQGALKVHLRTHSGETPFHCNICEKRYAKRSGLFMHMQKHGEFVRYTCITCGEQFSTYDKYHTHRRQHLGLPFKCGVCERQFRDAHRCKRHVRGVHKILDDTEVQKLAIRIYDTKEYRGKMVEIIKRPEEEGYI